MIEGFTRLTRPLSYRNGLADVPQMWSISSDVFRVQIFYHKSFTIPPDLWITLVDMVKDTVWLIAVCFHKPSQEQNCWSRMGFCGNNVRFSSVLQLTVSCTMPLTTSTSLIHLNEQLDVIERVGRSVWRNHLGDSWFISNWLSNVSLIAPVLN